MLLFQCWLFAILIPVVIPMAFRYLGWAIALAVVIPICFMPSLFCKLRYTAGRRTALREHYRDMKRPGRKLIHIHSFYGQIMVCSLPPLGRTGVCCKLNFVFNLVIFIYIEYRFTI